MFKFVRPKIARGPLWAGTVLVVSVGAYFLGMVAEAAFANLMTSDTPSADVKLEEQGRYDEAIEVVLDERKEGLPEADVYSRVSMIYLDRARKDLANREKWAQESASYSDKALASAPKDPFILESAMDRLDRVGDYTANGCSQYEKALSLGEDALALLQGSTVTVEGYARSYPTQPIKESIQRQLKRIRGKVEACCKETSQR